MVKKLPFFLAGSFIFFLFVLFSYLVHKDLFSQFDFNATVRLQDNIDRRFDELFSLFSVIGTFEISVVVLLIIIAMHKKIVGVLAMGVFAFLHIVELYGKFFVDHLPPPEFMIRTEKLVSMPQFHVRAEFSYPSGHAARAAFLSILIAIILARSKKIGTNQKVLLLSLLVVYDGIMLVSRVYLGEHWSTDVIGGALLGVGLALISILFL